MAEFMQLDLSQPAAKGLLASFMVLLVGTVFSIHAQLTGGKTSGSGERYLKCANPECDYTEELTADQQKERAKELIENYKTENPEEYRQWLQTMAQKLYGPLAQGGAANDAMVEQNLIASWGNADIPLAFTCPKCNQNTVFNAVKCEKCGKIFFYDASPGGTRDTCPECGYSKDAERAKQRKAEKLQRKK